MKFKIDENLPFELADELRAIGYDADTVSEERLSGAPDPKIIAAAQAAGRILLTMDKGFADMRLYPPSHFAGIVLFRPKKAGRLATLRFVLFHLLLLRDRELAGRLVVVSEAGMRFR